MNMNRIKFLSAENGTWNIKTAANPLAVSSYPYSGQDNEVLAVFVVCL